MTSHSHTTTYSFLAFKFTPSQHLLHHQGKVIQLSKKNHDLLLALVESNADVIEKNDLIEQIWPNQIVTDAALNKQVTRLRQLLAEYDQNPIIETIRGVGIRFVCELDSEIHDSNSIKQSRRFTAWAMALIMVTTVVVLWMLKKNQPSSASHWESHNIVNMAIIPSFNDTDWLNVGAIDYLSEKFRAHPKIQAIGPEPDWFNRDDIEIFGIELSQIKGIEYVLMLENRNNQNNFSTDLLLRTADKVIAKKSFQATSVTLLLNQIETWTLQQLNIEIELSESQQSAQNHTSEFVIETYLRGLAAAQAKQYTQAQRLLMTATKEDPNFYPAWFTLTEVENELGHFDKALGLINALADSAKNNPKLTPKIKSIKASVLVYLNRLDEAQKLIDQSNEAAQVNQDVDIIMNNLAIQASLNDYNGDSYQNNLLIQKELLRLTQKHNPSPNKIATVQHNLSVAYLNTGDIENATDMIERSIDHFEAANNAEGIVSSYRVKGNILSMQAKNGEALLAMNKALPWLDQVDGARALANFWITKTRSHLAQGELAEAQNGITALHQMTITYATLQARVKALILEVEMAITFKDFPQGQLATDQLLAIIVEDPTAYPSDAPYAVALDLYLQAVSGDVVSARTKKQQYLDAYPSLADDIPLELQRIEAHILAGEGYLQQATEKLELLEQSYLAGGDTFTANYIANEIIQIQGYQNLSVLETIINRVKNRPHFVYPINKHHANLLYNRGQLISALTVMSELKSQSKDFWQPEDQLLLETWQAENRNQ